jgi:histidinol-phosphatase (PHP family)
MRRSCARAVELGLSAIAFTEHADFTPWTIDAQGRDPADFPPQWASRYADGVFTPPVFDLPGYRDCLDACRDDFPRLRILSGVELGEPHWHPDRTRRLLTQGRFDRVLASLHSYPDGTASRPIGPDTYGHRKPEDLMRWYLNEVERLAEEFDGFELLAHLDFPVRFWPGGPAAFDPHDRGTGARRPRRPRQIRTDPGDQHPHPAVPGPRPVVATRRGTAVTFSSDAHDPDTLAQGFRAAAAMAEVYGFRPGRHPHDPWPRE